MITIKSLTDTSYKEIHQAFKNAFADYVEPFDLTLEQLTYMLERRDCNLDISFGAFDNNDLVCFILNGVGYWNKKLTAYDTGTGTVKEYRKKGLATKVFNDSLPVFHKNKISQYLLEVIRVNNKAFDLYKKTGFEITREFEYYVSPKNDIRFRETKLTNNYTISEIKQDWDLFRSFWDFNPSWQNSIDSINRKINHFKILGLFNDNNIVGYGIIEKHTGDIPQLAINKKYRNKGLATSLFKELINNTDSENIKIINVYSKDIPFNNFMQSIGLNPGHGQYEMILKM